MKTIHRVILALLVVAVAGAGAYWFTLRARRPAGAPPLPEAATKPGPDVVLTSPELSHHEDGKLAWKVILEEVNLETGGGAVAVKGLREGIIYDKTGLPALQVTAKSVKGDTLRKDFEMMGDVVVTSPKGFVIATEQVKWMNDAQTIHCPGVVKMKSKSLVIATTGMDYLLTTDDMKCPNQVRMYSGNNRVVGRSLTYNVTSGIADITDVQMVINPKEAKEILKELGSP